MAVFYRLMVVAGIAWVANVAVAIVAEPAVEFDIRDAEGNKLVSADQIRYYDWGAHTLTLVPGARTKLVDELQKGGRLASGVPFTVCLGGKPVYEGNFTIVAASKSFTTPCILMDLVPLRASDEVDQLCIWRSYPTNQSFNDDPRRDEQIRKSLTAAGKLAKSIQEHTAWVAGSMLEMASIKPGMTRAQLLKVFQEEGGISTRQWRRYAFRDCPYFKVNVDFEPVGSPDEKIAQDPRDIIKKISPPFLEWMIAD